MENTWERHRPNGRKARVWKRDDGVDSEYQWFYVLPTFADGHVTIGSIACTWEEAMTAVRMAYVRNWMHAHGLEGVNA